MVEKLAIQGYSKTIKGKIVDWPKFVIGLQNKNAVAACFQSAHTAKVVNVKY